MCTIDEILLREPSPPKLIDILLASSLRRSPTETRLPLYLMLCDVGFNPGVLLVTFIPAL